MTKRMLKRDWVNRYVKVKQRLINGAGTVFDPGEIMRVTANFGGLHLKRLKVCDSCGRLSWQTIKDVAEYKVELLPEDFRPNEAVQTSITIAITPEEQRAILSLLGSISVVSSEYGALWGLQDKIQLAANYDTDATRLPTMTMNVSV